MAVLQPEQGQGAEAGGESSGLGRVLKRARLAQGYDIPDVAQRLRIRPEYLEALEEGDHAKLPGRVYAIGFVRTYSSFLGLDSAVAIERFKSEAVSLDHAHLLPPTPPPEGRVPGGALLFVSLVSAIVLYGGWWVMSAEERRLPEIVAEVPTRLQQLVDVVAQAREAVVVRLPRGESSPSTGPGTASAAPPPVVPPMPVAVQPQPLAQPASSIPVASLPDARPAEETENAELSEDDESARPAPESVAAASTATALTPSAPAPAAAASLSSTVVAALPASVAPPSADPGVGRILLRAREENWVQVRDGANAPLMTRVLKPGDILKVPDRGGLTLMTGNAGGLDILVDGEAVPSLGAPGQVRRNVALDADKLKAGTAIGRP
jgi:cytoskeleton protein RodZ